MVSENPQCNLFAGRIPRTAFPAVSSFFCYGFVNLFHVVLSSLLYQLLLQLCCSEELYHVCRPSSREDSQLGPSIMTKAKAARAPRSSSITSTNPSVHSSRTSTIAESRPILPATAPAKTQPSIGPSNRKRPAPSGSSSPPGPPAQWGSQRSKMARVARRVISVPSRDDCSPVVESVGLSKEGNGIPPTPVARSTTPGATSGSGLARRVTASATHSVVPKLRVEKPAQSLGVSGSEESEEDAEKAKEKVKKTGMELGDSRPASSSQKMGSIVSPAKKTHVVLREVGLQGDGVRRQGRTGRGAVTPRATSVIPPPPEKVEVSPAANAKQLRSARAAVDAKPDRLVMALFVEIRFF